MDYDVEKDLYICKNGRELPLVYIRHSKSKTGYVSKKNIYQCTSCENCPYKSECIKGNNCKTPMEKRNKVLSVARTFLKYRREDSGMNPIRRRNPDADKQEYTGRRFFRGVETGYAVPKIFKPWRTKCPCRKCSTCNGEESEQTA